MPNFGAHTGRPGGEPPPRRQLTPEEIRVRETFNRADHLAGKTTQSQPQAEQVSANKAFDEPAIRAALAQEGLDFTYSIFPIGEKPADPGGRNQHREARINELESERLVIRKRMIDAEATAASAIRELTDIKIERDTILAELEALKAANTQEAT